MCQIKGGGYNVDFGSRRPPPFYFFTPPLIARVIFSPTHPFHYESAIIFQTSISQQPIKLGTFFLLVIVAQNLIYQHTNFQLSNIPPHMKLTNPPYNIQIFFHRRPHPFIFCTPPYSASRIFFRPHPFILTPPHYLAHRSK